jgi:hypothetical protein
MQSNNHTLSELAARLDRLEAQNGRLAQQNRWLKRVAVLAGVLGTSILCLSHDQAAQAQKDTDKTLEATSLTLRDGSGKVRAYLGPAAQREWMQFTIFDPRGKARFSMTAADIGTLINVSDDEGKENFKLLSSAKGGSQLQLKAAGKAIVTMLSHEKTPSIGINDPMSKAGILMRIDENRQPSVAVFGSAGEVRWHTPVKSGN